MLVSRDRTGRQPRVHLAVERPGEGTVVDRTETMHSYTDNWYLLMGVLAHDDELRTVTDISGTDHDIGMGRAANNVMIEAGTKTELGIGSSNGSFSQTNNSLGTLITRNQTSEGDVEEASQLVRQSASFSISASHTIRETGAFLNGTQDKSGDGFRMLIERTVLANPFDVVNGDSVSVTYEWTWSGP